MTHEESSILVESIFLLRDILGSTEKVSYWLVTPNLHLGGTDPMRLFLIGRGHKVLRFIWNAKEENWP